jgi:hypothetical protein
MSIENLTLAHFRHFIRRGGFSSLFANLPSTSVENPLQINLFMQNKPNLRKSQMNANPYNTRDYENKSNWTLGQSKPNSNPIKACPELVPKVRIEFTLSVIEGNGPILERMNVNFCATGYYESKPTFAANNPNVDITTAWTCGARIVA